MRQRIIGAFLVLTLAVSFPAARAAAPAEEYFEKYKDILLYYYRDPAPDRVPGAVKSFLESPFFKSGEASAGTGAMLTAYLFGRMAQLSPPLIKEYQKIFDQTDAKGRGFLLGVFQVCGNEPLRKFLTEKLQDPALSSEKEAIAGVLEKGIPLELDFMGREAVDSNDLDFYWAEFTVTGNPTTVKKIVNVLGWPDRSREKLRAWLAGPAPAEEKTALADLLREEYSIQTGEKGEILSAEDIDIRIASALMAGDSKTSFKKVKAALGYTKEELLHLATKGSAAWSLESNAGQHSKVLEILLGEIPKRKGAVLIELLHIAAKRALLGEKPSEARPLLERLAKINPSDAAAHFSLGALAVNERNWNAAEAELRRLEPLDRQMAADLRRDIRFAGLEALPAEKFAAAKDAPDAREVAGRIKLSGAAFKGYESRMKLRDFSQRDLDPVDHVAAEWTVTFVKPDRYFVDQTASDGTADRWISAGGEHYFFVGMWIHEPKEAKDMMNRSDTNRLVSFDKYLEILDGTPELAGTCLFEKKSLAVLRFRPAEWKGFNLAEGGKGLSYEILLYAEPDSGLVRKAVARITGKTGEKAVDTSVEQFFIYSDDLRVEPPAVALEPGKK